MTSADITFDQRWFLGSDKQLEFTLDDISVDPSTWTMRFVLKRHVDDTSVVFVKNTGGDGITVEQVGSPGEGWRVVVDVSDTDTDGNLPGWYAYTLRREDEGFEDVIQAGRAYLRKAVMTSA